MIDLRLLEHELTTAYRGLNRPVWGEGEAKALANMVHEDMTIPIYPPVRP